LKKKRKVGNTAARSMAWLRKLGYLVAKVEKFNSFIKIRQDMFGFADIVAIRTDKFGVLAIQTTHVNFTDDHIELLRKLPVVKVWLDAKNRIWLIGWGKFWNPAGTRKIWAPSVVDVSLSTKNRLMFKPLKGS